MKMGVITPKILLRFWGRIKPCLIHGVTHRTATPSERQKTRYFKDFPKHRRIGHNTSKRCLLAPI